MSINSSNLIKHLVISLSVPLMGFGAVALFFKAINILPMHHLIVALLILVCYLLFLYAFSFNLYENYKYLNKQLITGAVCNIVALVLPYFLFVFLKRSIQLDYTLIGFCVGFFVYILLTVRSLVIKAY